MATLTKEQQEVQKFAEQAGIITKGLMEQFEAVKKDPNALNMLQAKTLCQIANTMVSTGQLLVNVFKATNEV